MSITNLLTNAQLPAKVRISCSLTLCGIVAIIGLLLSGSGSVVAKLLLTVPFALVIPGLVSGWYRSYSWLSLLILLYFIVAVTRAMAPAGSWSDAVFLTLTVVVFFGAAFSSRWLQQWRGRAVNSES